MTLTGTKFDNSILYLSNFADANLNGASFDGADIEHTSFESASLVGAKFTLREDARAGKQRWSYIYRLLQQKQSIHGPNFNCADLREADFTGHPIFGFVGKPLFVFASVRSPIYVLTASFVGADLVGTNFEDAVMFGASPPGGGFPFPPGSGQRLTEEAGEAYWLFEYEISEVGFKDVDPDSYEGSLYRLREGFSGSSWSAAKMPPAMGKWLQSNPPERLMVFGIGSS